MAFQLSPGVLVKETDLTTIVPQVATTGGAFVGPFRWGPVNQPVLIDNELTLLSVFGKPDAEIAPHWFTAANFLTYGNNLQIVRVIEAAGANASVLGVSTPIINNKDDYDNTASGDLNNLGTFAAKYPGSIGNSLKVAYTDENRVGIKVTFSTVYDASDNFTVGATVYNGPVADPETGTVGTGKVVKWEPAAVGAAGSVLWLEVLTGTFAVSGSNHVAPAGNAFGYVISAVTSNVQMFDAWDYASLFDGPPGTSAYVSSLSGTNDEIHVVVIDEDGVFSGEPGTILETFPYLSKAADAKTSGNVSNYYASVINDSSNYVWWTDHHADGTNWGDDAASTDFVQMLKFVASSLSGGANGSVVSDDEIIAGWAFFEDPETTDIALLVGGPNTVAVAQEIITVAEARKDCVAFISPESADVVGVTSLDRLANVVAFRNSVNTSSSYAVMDSGWKYQYDKYNDTFIWAPLNGDIAGLCAKTDTIADPWWSPAGFNRGQIRNVIKLAFNPKQSERDVLYKNGINPVVSFPGEGTVLYGDKTLLSRPSAFDRINVRRLFIVLEKAIAIAAKYSLFEFNDEFTRSQFRAMVEPFLRDIQGRRGITKFEVVADSRNNTPQVIQSNRFVADIYIQPNYSINFIQLNAIATRSGVNFEEIVGRTG